MKVLLADADADALDVTTYALRRAGFEVLGAGTGAQAVERWRAEAPDVVLVDLGLPRQGAFEACRLIRRDSDTPIVLLAAAGDEPGILRGLELGADDVISTPVSPALLAARLRALLRRCRRNPYEHAMGAVRAGDLVLDLETYEARNRHGVARLTALEFKVLYLLAMNEGRVIPYARLVDHAWGFEGGDANLLKTHVCHLRKKLRLPADGPGSIRSLPGIGYSLAKTPAVAVTPAMTPGPASPRQASEAPRRLPLRRRVAARGAARLAHGRARRDTTLLAV